MAKRAISVTISPHNLIWLQARARVSPKRSVSEALDILIAEARASSRSETGAVRSVVGTISIAKVDAGLDSADVAIRALFAPAKPVARKRSRPHAGSGAKRQRG